MHYIYGIKNCSTMKKAFNLFDELGVDYIFVDYKKQDVSQEQLNDWVEKLGIDTVLNKRGTTWRKQTDEVKAEAETDVKKAINLMAENTSMIKRPILENTDKNILLAGFDIHQYTELLKSESN